MQQNDKFVLWTIDIVSQKRTLNGSGELPISF